MTFTQAMRARHSVRQYTEKPLDEDVALALLAEIGLGIVKYPFELGAGKEKFCWRA